MIWHNTPTLSPHFTPLMYCIEHPMVAQIDPMVASRYIIKNSVHKRLTRSLGAVMAGMFYHVKNITVLFILFVNKIKLKVITTGT